MSAPTSYTPSSADLDPAIDPGIDPGIETALHWIVRLHSGEASAEDHAAYEAWRTADLRNRMAADEAEGLWQAIGVAERPRLSRRAALRTIVGLGILGVGLHWLIDSPPFSSDLRTGKGERRSIVMADGSQLQIDADSRLSVDFTAERRRIMLYRGRVHATVASDTLRPFEIIAQQARIVALGTAFQVELSEDQGRVAVTQHSVRVTYPLPDGAETTLRAGEAVTFGRQQGLGPVSTANIQALTAWQRGRLVFDATPLSNVVAEIGRYSRGYILITSAELRHMPVTGIFDADDGDGLIDLIAKALPVRIQRLPGLTLIEPAPR